MNRKWLPAAAVLFALAGCASGYEPIDSVPSQGEAYALMDQAAQAEAEAPYRIGPDDTIRIDTFFEPELSVEAVKVDRSGQIGVPGIGSMTVKGLTTKELATQIEDQFRGRLLERPQVAVSVVDSADRKVVVTGQVNYSGVFEIRNSTTLLEAIALARGENEVAKMDEVIIFRTIDGQRMAARFDVNAIRSGAMEDPRILGNDLVVVGFSEAKSIWRDIRQIVPVFAVFRPLYS
ncbi:polysaccharide biosynthesis/export family protein [Croceicoccus mobilis]|uniref:Polysaccharide export protein n=1 Tax=Croceicoccus mobilis TaxID=1703339 RepID=A0A917DPW4_9SPHN|nr:polysaccharide biosynthesis/export family protein [Croceicoccus mobilis]GGD59648.1 hypothetical protein GCM10010990_06280 [Croceicoccus mobilis]